MLFTSKGVPNPNTPEQIKSSPPESTNNTSTSERTEYLSSSLFPIQASSPPDNNRSDPAKNGIGDTSKSSTPRRRIDVSISVESSELTGESSGLPIISTLLFCASTTRSDAADLWTAYNCGVGWGQCHNQQCWIFFRRTIISSSRLP